ncbi:unnamed protein product [Didymodactylos carnosus]|uniref:Uncharacterized protein n=1 Tax=Didymodactylos carnosus TaxID=1234261 RepID=A0A813Z6K7_9BILA|nr:unnamed protein product [Didymodactylos carnosus]CAF3677758.1 unnamed protein product [Didymodactylos carnosus]
MIIILIFVLLLWILLKYSIKIGVSDESQCICNELISSTISKQLPLAALLLASSINDLVNLSSKIILFDTLNQLLIASGEHLWFHNYSQLHQVIVQGVASPETRRKFNTAHESRKIKVSLDSHFEENTSGHQRTICVKRTNVEPDENNPVNGRSQYLGQQLAIKLAWAATVDKIQGATVKELVCCTETLFGSGRGYIQLSRISPASDDDIKLILIDVFEEKFYCDEQIARKLERIKRFVPLPKLIVDENAV